MIKNPKTGKRSSCYLNSTPLQALKSWGLSENSEHSNWIDQLFQGVYMDWFVGPLPVITDPTSEHSGSPLDFRHVYGNINSHLDMHACMLLFRKGKGTKAISTGAFRGHRPGRGHGGNRFCCLWLKAVDTIGNYS